MKSSKKNNKDAPKIIQSIHNKHQALPDAYKTNPRKKSSGD